MLGWLLRRWFDRPDKALKKYAFGVDQRFTGYDQDQMAAGRLRALAREAARRRLEDGIGRRGEIREWRRDA